MPDVLELLEHFQQEYSTRADELARQIDQLREQSQLEHARAQLIGAAFDACPNNDKTKPVLDQLRREAADRNNKLVANGDAAKLEREALGILLQRIQSELSLLPHR